MFRNVGESRFKIYARPTLLAVFLITGFFVLQFSNIKMDYDFEKFFPVDDDETEFFFDFRNKFESDNDFLLIALENDKGIFDWAFLEKARSYQDEVGKIPHVQFSRSILSEEERLVYPGGASTSRPLINFENRDIARDKRLLLKNQELHKTLISKDLKSLLIFVRHDDYLIEKGSDSLVNNIKALTNKYNFDNSRIAGRTIGQNFYIDKMTYEMILFVGISMVLVTLFLLIAFRSGWGLFLPLIVIMGSMTWVMGFIGLYGEPISVVMTTLPSIMFVVAMSDVIHLLSRYLDAFRTGISKLEAIKTAMREVGLATFLTSITTAIGFFSLMFVSVQPLQVFGLVTGFGVLIAFVLTFMLLPVLIYFFPSPKYVRASDEDPFWSKRLSRWFVIVLRKRKVVLIWSGIIMAVCIAGASQIQVNNFLMDELSEDEPMKMDFNYLDANYGGVRPVELAVTLKDTSDSFWNLEIMEDLEKVETYMEKSYGATIKLSIVKAVKVMNRSMHSGNADYYSLPERGRDLSRLRRPLRIAGQGKVYHLMVDSTETIARISGVIPDWGSKVVMKKNKELQEFLTKELKNSSVDFQLTGTAHLFDKNISYLSTSMVKGLSISILIVALLMGLLYRSVSMVVISIIPNLIPLIFIAGIMGFFGIELKSSTAIIFTIAFGIAVDDTIHYLGKFKYELMKGRSKMYALKRSYLTTGKAMIITSLILCSGFLMLVLSSFLGTFLMGLMLCATLLVALVADLTILPVLLLLFYKQKEK